jgi:hypothetical protein
MISPRGWANLGHQCNTERPARLRKSASTDRHAIRTSPIGFKVHYLLPNCHYINGLDITEVLLEHYIENKNGYLLHRDLPSGWNC